MPLVVLIAVTLYLHNRVFFDNPFSIATYRSSLSSQAERLCKSDLVIVAYVMLHVVRRVVDHCKRLDAASLHGTWWQNVTGMKLGCTARP